MAAPQKDRFVAIDNEGYFKFGEVRVTDPEAGRLMFKNLRIDDKGRYLTTLEGTDAFVEAFDEPLVALQVHKKENSQVLQVQMPYGVTEDFDLKTLSLDEWDRFHGVTTKGIPFVFARPAQAEFFNMADDYDDDSITLDGKKIVLPPHLITSKDVEGAKYWSGRYLSEPIPGWDLGKPTPILRDILAQLKLPKSRFLVLCAGRAHDAVFLREQGHLVTAVDISPDAARRFRETYPDEQDITYVTADMFALPPRMQGTYDVILDHTSYCAINPSKRNDLIKVWHRTLAPGGHLLGLFLIFPQRQGPPFGASEHEIYHRMKKNFDMLYWTRWKNSVPERAGQELVVYAQRK